MVFPAHLGPIYIFWYVLTEMQWYFIGKNLRNPEFSLFFFGFASENRLRYSFSSILLSIDPCDEFRFRPEIELIKIFFLNFFWSISVNLRSVNSQLHSFRSFPVILYES